MNSRFDGNIAMKGRNYNAVPLSEVSWESCLSHDTSSNKPVNYYHLLQSRSGVA
jgi:hypothetical protein